MVDTMIEKLFEGDKKEEVYRLFSDLRTNRDLSSGHLPRELKDLVFDQGLLPTWMEADLVREGQSLFREFTQEILGLLGALSLPYCYAAAKGARVLYLSEKIRTNTQQRLLDTTSFVTEVMQEGSLDDDGTGLAAILRIRLRHSLVRYYIGRHPAWQERDEVPVNQEDQGGTNLAFSYIVLNGLEKLGFSVNHQSKRAFLHLWNVIAYGMGTKDELLPANLQEAYWLEQTIRRRQFNASPEGRDLTISLVNHYKKTIPDRKMKGLIVAQMQDLVGAEVAEILGLQPGPVERWILQRMLSVLRTKNAFLQHQSTYELAMKDLSRLQSGSQQH